MEHVGFYKMREGYPTTRLYAKCCWTVLLGDHPSYKEKIVVTYGTETAGGVVCCTEVRALSLIFWSHQPVYGCKNMEELPFLRITQTFQASLVCS
eukprot:2119389-Amphidinium_carterae.2